MQEKTVKVKAVISSNSIAYNVPKEFDSECTNIEKHVCKEESNANSHKTVI